MPKIYTVGIAVVDFLFEMEAFPQDGEKLIATNGKIISGGPATNAAVTAVRLGGEAALTACVGDDLLGDLIAMEMQTAGVDTRDLRRVAGAMSSFSSVYLDAAGERQIVNFRGEALRAAMQDASWITPPADADVVLADSRWPAGLTAALAAARARDLPSVVDAETPKTEGELDADAVLQSLAAASHTAFSKHGLLALVSHSDVPRALAEVARKLRGWVCVTDGANGVYFSAGRGVEHIPAFAVEVADTMAAGDVWHGAFALRIGEGAGEEDAVVFANAAAGLKCAAGRGRDGCPGRGEVEGVLGRF